jgi:arylsulfatase A-like enzyme
MKRFLLLITALGVLQARAAPPNILLLIGDNWSYAHAGANGDPVVKTPLFDGMCRKGMRFTHAFCPVPCWHGQNAWH